MRYSHALALFPGQGSQTVGMGAELFTTSSQGRDLFNRADKVTGSPLSNLCFNGPAEELTLTQNAQPAILTVSTICFQLAQATGDTTVCKPAVAAGHSLGEYSALVAADALSFDDAVLLVRNRGKYMQEAVPAGTGKMIAVLGKELVEIEEAVARRAEGDVDVANINAPGQVVISGTIAGADAVVKALGPGRYIDLPVSAPFHSRLMEPAAQQLARDLQEVEVREPAFPVISNVTARPHGSPEEIRELLAQQVSSRVRWTECIEYARSEFTVDVGLEFGSGKVLAGLMRRIDKKFPVVAISSEESLQELLSSQQAA